MPICLNHTFLCQYPNLINSLLDVSPLDAMKITSGPWLQNSGVGPVTWDGRHDQASGLGAEGRKLSNHYFILKVCTVTNGVLPSMLSLPASDLILMVLTPVSRDVLRGCKCCLSGGWCFVGLIAETPSKFILSCASSLVVVQPSIHWWATPLLCFCCSQGVNDIYFSKSDSSSLFTCTMCSFAALWLT